MSKIGFSGTQEGFSSQLALNRSLLGFSGNKEGFSSDRVCDHDRCPTGLAESLNGESRLGV